MTANPDYLVEGVRIELVGGGFDARIQKSKPGGDRGTTDSVWLTGQTFVDPVSNKIIAINNFNPGGNPTAQVTVSQGAFFAVPPGSWQIQPGLLTQISAGYDGTVMGVSGNNQIWQWNGTDWNLLPGLASMIAVVNSDKALVSPGSSLWVGNRNGWTQVNLPNGVTGIIWISAAADGTLYAVDSTGDVNRLDAVSGIWSVVGANAGHVAAQSGISFYMIQNGNGALPAGTVQMIYNGTATTLPSPLLIDISVDGADAGDLWGVSASNNIYHWNGASWDQQPGTFTQVAIGIFNNLWALDVNQAARTGTIYQWH